MLSSFGTYFTTGRVRLENGETSITNHGWGDARQPGNLCHPLTAMFLHDDETIL